MFVNEVCGLVPDFEIPEEASVGVSLHFDVDTNNKLFTEWVSLKYDSNTIFLINEKL